jgi:predicted metalloprotease with PDZ domain
VDFYDEGWLIWLEADMVIRRESHGQKSLDDFCRRFYGPPNTPPQVVPYTLDDIVTAMNQTLPYDWRGFFHARVDEINEHPPLGGVEIGGWRLIYNDTPNQTIRASESVDSIENLRFSLGIEVQNQAERDHRLADVIPGMPAAEAGLAPGMKLVTVNSRDYSETAMSDAIQEAKNDSHPIVVTASNAGITRTYDIQYHGGQRYPHLERNTASPNLLAQSLHPLTGNPAAGQGAK